ncbi:MAG: PAS domain-containing protein [Phycisphaerae bacterium]|nr:PAS domain-containing protein [Phycisphaerae bacterium]
MSDNAESLRHRQGANAPDLAGRGSDAPGFTMGTTVILASALTILLLAGLGVQVWRSYRDHAKASEQYFPVLGLTETIIYFDEVLTMSAHMAAETGDPQWQTRYRRVEPQLDAAIDTLKKRMPGSLNAQAAAQTYEANVKLVELENRVFQQVAQQRLDEAQAILSSDEYRRHKTLYRDGIQRVTADLQGHIAAALDGFRRRALAAAAAVLVGLPLLAVMWLRVIRDMKRYLAERDRAEGKVRESEERFRSLVANIPGAVYRCQAMYPWAVQHMSEAVFKITGHRAGDFMDQKIAGIGVLIADEDVANVILLVDKAIAAHSHFDVTYRMRHADGGVRWVHDTGRAVYDPDGKPVSLDGVVLDVTETKEAERQLRQIEWLLTKRPTSQSPESESYQESYGSLADSNAAGIILESVGRRMLAEIAKDYIDMLGTSCAVYEKNGDYALGVFAAGWCRILDTASRRLCGDVDNALALKCGRWFCHESCWSEASKTAIETGKPVDIGCRGGIRLYAVPIYAGDEVVGAISFGYGDPPKDPHTLTQLAGLYGLDYDELRKTAESYESRPAFIIELAKERLQTSAELIGAIVEKKLAERERERLLSTLETKNKELQSIVYVASHDLKSPLVNIDGFSTELAVACEQIESVLHREETPAAIQQQLARVLDEDIPQAIGFIRAGTTKMQVLLHGLLQVARVGTADVVMTLIDMNAMMDHILAGMQFQINASGVAVTVDKLPDCVGDALLVNQVFTNLLDNAIKYRDPNRQGLIHVSGRIEGPDAVFCVEDTGIGIAREHLSKVFDLFHRLEPMGTVQGEGLGLTIARRILDRIGGKIWVESQAQKGSRFFVRLPAPSSPQTPPETPYN